MNWCIHGAVNENADRACHVSLLVGMPDDKDVLWAFYTAATSLPLGAVIESTKLAGGSEYFNIKRILEIM